MVSKLRRAILVPKDEMKPLSAISKKIVDASYCATVDFFKWFGFEE